MADATTEYDLVVIGGGPAGYAGAIRAGRLGKKVACIEMERAGGTCLELGLHPDQGPAQERRALPRKSRRPTVYGLSVKEVVV